MEIFFNSRCQLAGNFYEDIFECLDYFHNQNIKIGILTNGSADLTRCEELNKYLFIKMTAADVGISKPSPVGFLACSQVNIWVFYYTIYIYIYIQYTYIYI